MQKRYLGFNIGDSMFDGPCLIKREELKELDARRMILGGVISCLNRSHSATLRALKNRLGINVPIPDKPKRISLEKGDSILLVTSRGLPRHTDSYQYSDEDLIKATFVFSLYTLI